MDPALHERLGPVSAGDCQGYILRGNRLKCFSIDPPACNSNRQSKEISASSKLTVCCPTELASWCELSLGMLPSDFSTTSFARIPRYLHKRWSDQTPPAPAAEVSSEGSPEIKRTESARSLSAPPQKAFVTRILLLLLPLSENQVIMTPSIAAEKNAFERGQSPFVLRLACEKPKVVEKRVAEAVPIVKTETPVPRVTKRKFAPQTAESPPPPGKRREKESSSSGNLIDRMLGKPSDNSRGGERRGRGRSKAPAR